MSRMAFAPFREIAIDLLQMRDHRFPLACNHLAKCTSAQAPRCRSNERASKSNASSNARAVTHLMPTSVREIETAATTPLAAGPVQSVAARFAAWANHPRPYPALTPAHGRHGPLAQGNLDLDPAGRDHDHLLAAPGNPRVEGVGHPLPRQRDRSPDLGDGADGQAGCVAGEASIGTRVQT